VHRRSLLPVAVLAAAMSAALAGAGCDLLQPRPTAPSATGLGAWESGPAAPVPLTEIAAAAHIGEIWLAGGLTTEGRASNGVMVLDARAGTWRNGPALPEPVHHAALVSDGSTLYLLGGFAGEALNEPTDHVWMLRRPSDIEWLDLGPLPNPRAAGAAAWDGGRIVYAGGVGRGGVADDVFALGNGQWVRLGRLSEPREHLAATSDGAGNVYVLGGRRGGLQGNLATADLITSDGIRRIGELPTRRGGVAAFFAPSVGACLVGGESPNGTNPQVECIRATGELVRLPELRRPRHGLGSAVVDGVAYVLLGGEQPGLFTSDIVEALPLP
jgi:hypothetical protein